MEKIIFEQGFNPKPSLRAGMIKRGINSYHTLGLWALSLRWMEFPRNSYDGD